VRLQPKRDPRPGEQQRGQRGEFDWIVRLFGVFGVLGILRIRSNLVVGRGLREPGVG
jgi:hypothetical protein